MSDTMLLGVLRMPVNYVGGPLSPMAQLVARAREAADRIESDAIELARLRAENDKLRTACESAREALSELIDPLPRPGQDDPLMERINRSGPFDKES
jgi:hypothetical protein